MTQDVWLRPLRIAAGVLLAARTASAAAAQDTGASTSVADIVRFLVTNQGVQTSDFDRDQQAAEATRDTLTRSLLGAITTVPLGTSSGGFVYRFNPALGTAERASDTFGPLFVERALTAGAGQASLGFTLQYASFRSLDGNDLRDGTFVTVANQFTDEPRPFDTESLTLDVSTRTATFVGNLGLTPRLDVGAVVPLVRLQVDGSRVNTYRGRSLLQARAQAATTGLGDIAVRAKVRLTPDASPAGVAAAAELRLPTGRSEDLLGAGSTALRLVGIVSHEAGRLGVYGNMGVGMGGVSQELSWNGSVAVAATPRVTVIGEFLLQRLSDVYRIAPQSAPHPRITGVETLRLVPGSEVQTRATAVGGVKWNLGRTWLVHGYVLMPLNDAGLTTRVTPTVSLDYAFIR